MGDTHTLPDLSEIGGFAFLPDGMTPDQRNVRVVADCLARVTAAEEQLSGVRKLLMAVMIDIEARAKLAQSAPERRETSGG